MSTIPAPRHPAGSVGSAGGQFASRKRSDPFEALGQPTAETIARAVSGDVQVIYERDNGRIRITVLIRDRDAEDDAAGAVWVEEGSVVTDTPATADDKRIAVAISDQAARIADADDPHEETSWFLAGAEGHRDPAITRAQEKTAS